MDLGYLMGTLNFENKNMPDRSQAVSLWADRSGIKPESSVLTLPNPDLVVIEDDKPNWNLPDNRRHAFHNFEKIMRNIR